MNVLNGSVINDWDDIKEIPEFNAVFYGIKILAAEFDYYYYCQPNGTSYILKNEKVPESLPSRDQLRSNYPDIDVTGIMQKFARELKTPDGIYILLNFLIAKARELNIELDYRSEKFKPIKKIENKTRTLNYHQILDINVLRLPLWKIQEYCILKYNSYDASNFSVKNLDRKSYDTWEYEIQSSKPFLTQEELDEILPEATLYFAKKEKQKELLVKLKDAIEKGHCMSSLGFEIDANYRALQDTEILLGLMAPDGLEMFCDYHNEFHELTRSQIKIIRLEIMKYLKGVHTNKWAYQALIKKATNGEELYKVKIELCPKK